MNKSRGGNQIVIFAHSAIFKLFMVWNICGQGYAFTCTFSKF